MINCRAIHCGFDQKDYQSETSDNMYCESYFTKYSRTSAVCWKSKNVVNKSKQLRLSRRLYKLKGQNLDEAVNPIKPSALEKVKTLIGLPDNAISKESGSSVADNDIADIKFFTPAGNEVEIVEHYQFYVSVR